DPGPGRAADPGRPSRRGAGLPPRRDRRGAGDQRPGLRARLHPEGRPVAPVDDRVMGIETEFGVNATFRDGPRLAPEEVARYLSGKVVAWGRSSNVFLVNGSRLYLDVESHPEYATAE